MFKRKLLYEYNVKVQKELQLICKPLKDHLHLNFGYMKVYNDHRYFFLYDDLKFTGDYIASMEHDTVFCGQYIGELNNKNRFLYTLWPKSPVKQTSMQLELDYGYWSGMDVCFQGEDYLEVWWFSRDMKGEHYTDEPDFYIRNLDALTKFILYFQQHSARLLGDFDKKDLCVFKHGFDFSKAEFIPKEYNQVSYFLEELSHKALKINGALVKISPREIECLKYLCLGKTAKEMAKIMLISSRTVEGHMNNIKYKTRCYSKSDLIKLFQDSFLF